MGNGGTGSGSSGAACDTSIGGPLLYSAIPYTGTGSIFYTDAALTTPFNGGSLWYKLYNVAGEYDVIVQINSSGVVIDSDGCTTTTTSSTSSTTTTTTTVAPIICTDYTVEYTGIGSGSTVDYEDCDSGSPLSVFVSTSTNLCSRIEPTGLDINITNIGSCY
jgi:hypothetical protein